MRYVFGDHLLDTQRYELWRCGGQVKVRPKVFEVLVYLLRHRHRVVTKDELPAQLWPNQFIGDGSLNACLMAVRRAVGDNGQAQRCIQTLHGRGHRFIAAVEEYAEDTPQDAEQVVLAPAQTTLQPDVGTVPSEGSHRLVQAYFHCEPVGTASLGNAAPPLAVYRVLQDHGFQSRLEVMTVRGFTPLVGREAEVVLLLERWAQVEAGWGQVLLLSGDMGIGKSRLVQRLKEHVAREAHRWVECRCSLYFQQTPWYPLIDLLQRLCQWRQDDTPEDRLARLEQLLDQYRLPLATTVPLLAQLLALPLPPGRYRPPVYAPQQQRQHTLEALLALLLAMPVSPAPGCSKPPTPRFPGHKSRIACCGTPARCCENTEATATIWPLPWLK